MREPTIIVHGRLLTPNEAMTVRVALTSMQTYCGNDEHGRLMEKTYRESRDSILATILQNQ